MPHVTEEEIRCNCELRHEMSIADTGLLSLPLLWGDCGNDTGPPGWARPGATRGGRPDERLLRMQEQETAYKMLLHVSRWRLAHGDHVFVALVR